MTDRDIRALAMALLEAMWEEEQKKREKEGSTEYET